jgi:DNA-binding MurR/RpiR family transcriptional regulator
MRTQLASALIDTSVDTQESAQVGADLLLRIRGILPRLPKTAQKVANQILDDPALASMSSIEELAALSGTSQASVTRFCQAFDLRYAELRVKLAAASALSTHSADGLDVGTEIEANDSLVHLVQVVGKSNLNAIQQTCEQIELLQVERAITLLLSAKRIQTFGLGSSSTVAIEFEMRMQRINMPVWSARDMHGTIMAASLLGPDDVFFGISRSGKTIEVVEAMSVAKTNGAKTIALTSFPESPLADLADVVLTTHVQDTSVRHGSLAARNAQLLVVDFVYTGVAQRRYDESAESIATTSRVLASHRSARKSKPTNKERPILGISS